MLGGLLVALAAENCWELLVCFHMTLSLHSHRCITLLFIFSSLFPGQPCHFLLVLGYLMVATCGVLGCISTTDRTDDRLNVQC